MKSRFESLHPLVVLVDETSRLGGRLKSVFADVRRSVGLGDSEMMVLAAVVEAERAPTVPQIGRSLGHPRQLIQRAANALMEQGLIETVSNPDHKRAALLRATTQGIAVKRDADARADAIARALSATLDLDVVREQVRALGIIRRQLEVQLRTRALSEKVGTGFSAGKCSKGSRED